MTSKWFKNWVQIYRINGFKALIQEKGWIVAWIFFMFFLLKVIMWLILAYLLAKGLF